MLQHYCKYEPQVFLVLFFTCLLKQKNLSYAYFTRKQLGNVLSEAVGVAPVNLTRKQLGVEPSVAVKL